MSVVKRYLGDERIIRDPKICGGQPVFKGTRVTLRTVLEDVRAAIAFGAASAEEDVSLISRP